MILKINGVQVAMAQSVPSENFTLQAVNETQGRLTSKVDWVEVCTKYLVSSLALYFTMGAKATGGWALIVLLQQGAFWVGMAVSIWGVYLWQIGAPNWKEQIAKGFIGYLLVLVLPLLFVTLKNAHIGM